MAASITFQIKFIKFGSRERRKIWQNISSNLNAYNDFTVMLHAVRDQFTTIMRIYKSKGRNKIIKLVLEVKNLLIKDRR